MTRPRRLEAAWLSDEALTKLFDVLTSDGGEARIAGGAVRNTLLGSSVDDIDLSTTLLPDEVISRVEQAGHKAVPTGIEHGTITAVVDGTAYEVTTLREDIETDGRHAVVRFGTDWEADANRRDLTINGLYCDRDGQIFDYVGGLSDIQSASVRFIGEATTRIEEDALRILRFFRFFAWYGAGRPDAEGLKACAAQKHLLNGLSAERVWMELRKLLAAPDPGRALLWMRTTGVLSIVVPETEKWGIDSIPELIRQEGLHGWQADPLLRLMAIIRPNKEAMEGLSDRLRLSGTEKKRLEDWSVAEIPAPTLAVGDLQKLLFRNSLPGELDAMRLEVVHLVNRDDQDGANSMLSLFEFAEHWKKPVFPLSGQDLLNLGYVAGPEVGKKLSELESKWVESGFELSKEALLSSDD